MACTARRTNGHDDVFHNTPEGSRPTTCMSNRLIEVGDGFTGLVVAWLPV